MKKNLTTKAQRTQRELAGQEKLQNVQDSEAFLTQRKVRTVRTVRGREGERQGKLSRVNFGAGQKKSDFVCLNDFNRIFSNPLQN